MAYLLRDKPRNLEDDKLEAVSSNYIIQFGADSSHWNIAGNVREYYKIHDVKMERQGNISKLQQQAFTILLSVTNYDCCELKSHFSLLLFEPRVLLSALKA